MEKKEEEKKRRNEVEDELDKMLRELHDDKQNNDIKKDTKIKYLKIISPFQKKELKEEEYINMDEEKIEELKPFLEKIKSYKDEPENIENYNKIIKEKSYLFTLDNKDLVLEDEEYIYIYRYDNKEYKILQKIEKFPPYEKRKIDVRDGCFCYRVNLEYYYMNTIKLSNNKFLMISSYEMYLYFLDDKNKYSSICQKIDTLKDSEYVLNVVNNQFILYIYIYVPDGIGCPSYSIEKQTLVKPGTESCEKDLNISFGYYHLKNGWVCLKKKYFLYIMSHYIYLYNLENDKTISWDIVCYDENKIAFYSKPKIFKFDSADDDKFILYYCSGEIILFKLEETDKEPKLKIIEYFRDIKYIDCLNAKIDLEFKRNKLKRKSKKNKKIKKKK